MLKCCEHISTLGCFNSCDVEIETNIKATMSGIWTIEVHFNGTVFISKVSINKGDLITFPNKYNENYTHIARIYMPTGLLLNNTCYSFTTYQSSIVYVSPTLRKNALMASTSKFLFINKMKQLLFTS